MTAPPAPPENGAAVAVAVAAVAVGEKEKEAAAAAPDSHEIKTLRAALPQVLATSAKNLLLLGYGMTLGFPTITIPAITAGHNSTDPLQMSPEQISWFSSINLICVPVGCMLSGALTAPLGRKRAMQLVNVPFVAAWLMFHFATTAAELYAALALTGLAGGLMEAPVLTYVAEITQPRLRGALSATASMCVILGVFAQFLLGTFLPWRSAAAASAAFPVLAALALFFVPESPYWLVTKGRVAEAEQSLRWLRGWVPAAAVQSELAHLQASLQAQAQAQEGAPAAKGQPPRRQAWWRAYASRTFLQPYLLVSMAFLMGNFSGMTTLQTYSVLIFEEVGAPLDNYVATLYLGVAELAGTLVCVALVHWCGKRPLALVSMLGTGLCFGSVGVLALPAHALHAPRWLPLTLLLASAFLSHAGIRLLPWILIGEVYPAAVRGVASGASGSIGYIFSFVANKSFLATRRALSLSGTFFAYAAVAALGAAYLFRWLPETEGRTLAEIEDHYAGRRRLRRRRHTTAPAPHGVANPALQTDENLESRL